ncbi:Cuticlin-1 [Dirofilaria immitis]
MRSIILEYPGVLLITLLSLQCIWSLKAPLLECFTNGLRLYFQPDEPFSGHIYVKGSFMQKKCHLDYTQNPLSVPSYFPISYKNGCNMKCEEQNEPPGVNYRLLLVVQNHRLFVTKDDVIYSINCFYRKGFDSLTQDVEIRNGLTTVKLSGESTFKCSYQLLDSLNGNLVSYANVGDNLYHKWRCASVVFMQRMYLLRSGNFDPKCGNRMALPGKMEPLVIQKSDYIKVADDHLAKWNEIERERSGKHNSEFKL